MVQPTVHIHHFRKNSFGCLCARLIIQLNVASVHCVRWTFIEHSPFTADNVFDMSQM